MLTTTTFTIHPRIQLLVRTHKHLKIKWVGRFDFSKILGPVHRVGCTRHPCRQEGRIFCQPAVQLRYRRDIASLPQLMSYYEKLFYRTNNCIFYLLSSPLLFPVSSPCQDRRPEVARDMIKFLMLTRRTSLASSFSYEVD